MIWARFPNRKEDDDDDDDDGAHFDTTIHGTSVVALLQHYVLQIYEVCKQLV